MKFTAVPIRLVPLAMMLSVLLAVLSKRLLSGDRQRRTLPELLQRSSARPTSQRLIGLGSLSCPMPWRPCVSDHEPERLSVNTLLKSVGLEKSGREFAP